MRHPRPRRLKAAIGGLRSLGRRACNAYSKHQQLWTLMPLIEKGRPEGSPIPNSVLEDTSESKTVFQEIQVRSLRDALGYYLAAAVAPLIWGLR